MDCKIIMNQLLKKTIVFLLSLGFVWVMASVDNVYAFPDEYSYDGSDDVIREDGEAGWSKEKDGWHYYNEFDKEKKGWLKIGEIFFLDRKTGVRLTGWQTIDGGTYYFNGQGRLQTGWRKRGNEKYFLNKTGKPGEIGRASTGWKVIDGKRYHFRKSGEMNTGMAVVKGEPYYFKPSGEQRVGWIRESEDSRRYYYKRSDSRKKWGQMVKDTTFEGHYFTKDGLTGKLYDECRDVLDQVGWNLRAAYDWSSGLSYSGRTVFLEQLGSEKLARQGFEHRTGNCYVMAATFYEMACVLGYDAHQMAGGVPSRRGGITNHSWVEIVEDGEIWVYDPNSTMETQVDRFRFRYGTPGTWRYTDYHRMN